ncbi:MAG: hypothetical protein V2A65_10855 [Candidatus Omnitrophota bacterium]
MPTRQNRLRWLGRYDSGIVQKTKLDIILFLFCSIIFAVFSSGGSEEQPTDTIITVIVDKRGGRVDWSHTNNIITHCRYGYDGYYDLWTMNPDGSGAKCLTGNKPGIPQLHNGQPTWHSSGKYIVFQSQDPALPHTKEIDYAYTEAGHGLHNNLWITNPEGDKFYQLTKIKIGGAILHPCFSRDGKRLLWSEKVGKNSLDWAIKIADFIETPTPHLGNIKSYQPAGKTWYEAHEFSVDGSKILCTIGSGTEAYYNYDIWEMDMATQKLIQLTNTQDEWDEHAHYSPDGKKISWISSKGYPYNPSKWGLTLKTDLWIMDADGSNKERITYFNEPGYQEYTGKQMVMSDNSWGPDGKKIVAIIMAPKMGRKSAQIVIIDLKKALLRSKKKVVSYN